MSPEAGRSGEEGLGQVRQGEVRLDKWRSGEETFALGSAFSTYRKTTKLILEMIMILCLLTN